MRRGFTLLCLTLFLAPLTGSLGNETDVPSNWSSAIPEMTPIVYEEIDWWERTTMDSNRNGIFDSLESLEGPVGIGLSFNREVTDSDVELLESMGYQITDVIEAVDAVLLGVIDSGDIWDLSQIDGVVMVERYGQVILWGDIQTPNIKAEPSDVYPHTAWNHSTMKGAGINIAMVDTGTDNEHPGLKDKFVAGYDAVCYLHTDPTCALSGARETDGSFDPDDGNQHGTACMGMAAATGLDANGEQTGYEGSAPNASLIDVRIGTDAGAGPFENYLLSQEFYESAMNGMQWIIDNKDTAWQDADGTNYGIDILSLSWGITSHEGGGSDGNDMHSQILNEAMEAGIIVSVAAGNDGPSNDGLSGMGSSDLSLTVGATDDRNTVDRQDDTIADYSSRGPRRDNGDGNPLNELKPEITAPGTNIVQAEGCVTSGGCSNLLNDASQNGYTGRGSGTSYATPSVSGILALMIEANPELSPAELKEIIKLTAERRGEATQPEVDPFWNRDFGWGMADAYEATKMAIMLKEENLTGSIDVYSQVHVTNSSVNQSNGLHVIEGMAWSQAGTISAVEYRIGSGDWKSAAFDETSTQLAALERFTWMVALDLDALAEGNQTVEFRALNEQGVQSLPVSASVMGTGDGASNQASGLFGALPTSGYFILLSIIVIVLLWNSRTDAPLGIVSNEPNASIDAAIAADAEMAEVIDGVLVAEIGDGK